MKLDLSAHLNWQVLKSFEQVLKPFEQVPRLRKSLATNNLQRRFEADGQNPDAKGYASQRVHTLLAIAAMILDAHVPRGTMTKY